MWVYLLQVISDTENPTSLCQPANQLEATNLGTVDLDAETDNEESRLTKPHLAIGFADTTAARMMGKKICITGGGGLGGLKKD